MGILRNHSDLRALHEAGRITRDVLDAIGNALKPGISTMALETMAVQILARNRATAPFKKFEGEAGTFNQATCISINEEVVNGPPSRERLIQARDVVSVATAAEFRDIHAKAARTWYVSESPPENIRRLLEGTEQAIFEVIDLSRECRTLNQVLSCIPSIARQYRLTLLSELGGAGIGKKLHEAPPVPNDPAHLPESIPLQHGLAFTLMPMCSLGSDPGIALHEDGWTYVTNDGGLSAHFADTLLMGENGLIAVTR